MRRAELSYRIGIDEAGRGPLAGPVAVGTVMVPRAFDMSFFTGIKDSKQLSEKKREEWYAKMKSAQQAGTLRYTAVLSSNRVIDRRGVVKAIAAAMGKALVKLEADPRACFIVLDGSLKAPPEFLFQETIIRGDQTEPLISAAAIVAKVTRDRLMKRLAKRFPEYGFEIHKGYGTRRHRKEIAGRGLCPIHRATFCTRSVG